MAGARKASSKPAKSLEVTLWDAADKLRGNLEASEYKHVVLGLVFLKYVSDAFTARRLELETALADPNSDDHIPSEARRERILESAAGTMLAHLRLLTNNPRKTAALSAAKSFSASA